MTGGPDKGRRSTARRCCISSLQASAGDFNALVDAHAAAENGWHWLLDMRYAEDDRRLRIRNRVQNFNTLRRIAVNLLKQEKTNPSSVKLRRMAANWSTDYLEKVLGLPPRSKKSSVR